MKRVYNIYVKSFSGLSREVWVLSVVMLINRSGMMVLPFLTLYCTTQLNFTIIQAGIVAGMYGAGSLVGSWIGGVLTDRIGFYKVAIWSLFSAGFGLASIIFFKNFYALSAMIFVITTVADSVRPAIMAAISQYSKPENQTRSISLLRMAINLGIAIGPALGGFLAGSVGYVWLFIVDGFTCLLAGFCMILLLPPSKQIAVKRDPQSAKQKSVFSDHWYLIFLFVFLINIVAFIQILSTVPLFFKQILSLNEMQIGLFFTINGLLVFLFEMPLVYVSERKFTPFTSMIVGALLMAVGQLTLNLDAHWIIVILTYNVLISFGEIINFPFGNSESLTRAPALQKGKYMALWAMMFSTAFIIAPVLGTYIVDRLGFKILWMIMAGFHLLAMLGYQFIRPRWLKTMPSLEEVDDTEDVDGKVTQDSH